MWLDHVLGSGTHSTGNRDGWQLIVRDAQSVKLINYCGQVAVQQYTLVGELPHAAGSVVPAIVIQDVCMSIVFFLEAQVPGLEIHLER